ncbi:MAG TPA: FtsH protease activity modulator HflK [Xanthomonadales bacterium]|nr:FtsH protease activity modulator HflK [Xanthomonadales bacterium]
MAWNEPGGKRRDPWQGGGDKPPDLDAVLKRVRDRFGGAFGGSGGGGVFLVVVAILLVWFMLDSWRSIDESNRGVVLRFGKHVRTMSPGLNFKWPAPIEQVFVVETTKVRSTGAEVKMLTRDENIVIVDFNVQYLVRDPVAFAFRVREPEDTLRQAAESAVRGVIGSSEMDVILSGERTALAAKAKESLQSTIDRYGTGLVVSELNLQNLRPPPEVKDAFDDAITAREDKQRIENEAQAYSSKVLPEARGQAARIRAEAEGDKAEAGARATGAAKRFELVAEQYRAAPEVTRKRLMLETMQQVLAGSPKVMVEGGGDKVLYIPVEGLGSQPLSPVLSEPRASDRAPAVQAIPSVESVRTRTEDRARRIEERER